MLAFLVAASLHCSPYSIHSRLIPRSPLHIRHRTEEGDGIDEKENVIGAVVIFCRRVDDLPTEGDGVEKL